MRNLVISATDVPAKWAGRAVRCRQLDMVMVECIARGCLGGSGLKEYEKDGAVSGVGLPGGLIEGSKLPEPMFTPTTKVAPGELRQITLEVYRRGSEIAAGLRIVSSRWARSC